MGHFRISTCKTETIVAGKSKRSLDEIIKPPTTTFNSLAAKLKWIHNSEILVEFKTSYLKQDKATLNQRNMVKLFTVYGCDTWSRDLNTNFTPADCLFEVLKLTKNANPDKYGYSGYLMHAHNLHYQVVR